MIEKLRPAEDRCLPYDAVVKYLARVWRPCLMLDTRIPYVQGHRNGHQRAIKLK
jgi:hypothetical protein